MIWRTVPGADPLRALAEIGAGIQRGAERPLAASATWVGSRDLDAFR